MKLLVDIISWCVSVGCAHVCSCRDRVIGEFHGCDGYVYLDMSSPQMFQEFSKSLRKALDNVVRAICKQFEKNNLNYDRNLRVPKCGYESSHHRDDGFQYLFRVFKIILKALGSVARAVCNNLRKIKEIF